MGNYSANNWHSPSCGWLNKRSNIVLGPAQGTAPAVGCLWTTCLFLILVVVVLLVLSSTMLEKVVIRLLLLKSPLRAAGLPCSEPPVMGL